MWRWIVLGILFISLEGFAWSSKERALSTLLLRGEALVYFTNSKTQKLATLEIRQVTLPSILQPLKVFSLTPHLVERLHWTEAYYETAGWIETLYLSMSDTRKILSQIYDYKEQLRLAHYSSDYQREVVPAKLHLMLEHTANVEVTKYTNEMGKEVTRFKPTQEVRMKEGYISFAVLEGHDPDHQKVIHETSVDLFEPAPVHASLGICGRIFRRARQWMSSLPPYRPLPG